MPIVKLLLLLAYLVADYPSLCARFIRLDHAAALIVFSVLYLLICLGLFSIAQMRATGLRIGLALVLAGAAFVQLAYQKATGEPLDYEQTMTLYLSRSSSSAALEYFAGPIALAAVHALLLFAGLALPPGRHGRVWWQAIGVPILGLAALTVLIYSRGGGGARGFPPGYAPLSHALLFFAQKDHAAGEFRRFPIAPPGPPPAVQDLVLIVDESIGAHYLDLTRPDGVRSGLRRPPSGIRVFNYGHAAAISGCSVYSNYLLRFGGTQENFTWAAFTWPSIWAYARLAGFRTVYLDGQMDAGVLQNMMTLSEKKLIDDFVSITTQPVYQRDHDLADVIARYSKNGRRDFIYVNKVGAHFPIANKYPPHRTPYRPSPASERGDLLAAPVRNPTVMGLSSQQWAEYRNGYRNTLDWSVGAFFDRLFRQLDTRQTILLYTSDHGLDLHERGNPGMGTHCTADTIGMEQGLVPLVVIAPPQAPGLNWAQSLSQNYDRASAFRIFPTLLALMGYDRSAVRAHYGRPLDEQPLDRFARIARFNGLRGQKRELVDIDLRQMVAPPKSDYQSVRVGPLQE